MGVITTGIGVGFALGLRHALDADHLIAVTSLLSTRRRRREALAVGVWWGVGHAAAIVAVGSLLLATGWHFPERFQGILEAAVGVMILLLGLGVVRRHRRAEVHWHRHNHAGFSHAHFHRHDVGHVEHDGGGHHEHAAPDRSTTLSVGMIHGLAGGGPLVILLALAFPSFEARFAALVGSGVGSVVGMVLVTVVLMVPLARSSLGETPFFGRLRFAIGTLAVAYGAGFALRGVFGV